MTTPSIHPTDLSIHDVVAAVGAFYFDEPFEVVPVDRDGPAVARLGHNGHTPVAYVPYWLTVAADFDGRLYIAEDRDGWSENEELTGHIRDLAYRMREQAEVAA